MQSKNWLSPCRQRQTARLSRARTLLDQVPVAGRAPAPVSVQRPLEPGVHEWFSADRLPPLALLISMAWHALTDHPDRRIFWIGRTCWPYPHALLQRGSEAPDQRLLHASIYIDAISCADRVWAVEVASRCEGVGVVVADGYGLTMAESRRIQLAAAASRTSVQLVRPDEETAELSAARTRWRAVTQPGTDRSQAWTIELLRSKGGKEAWTGSRGARRWAVQRNYATGTIGEWQACDGDLASEVVCRSAATSRLQTA